MTAKRRPSKRTGITPHQHVILLHETAEIVRAGIDNRAGRVTQAEVNALHERLEYLRLWIGRTVPSLLDDSRALNDAKRRPAECQPPWSFICEEAHARGWSWFIVTQRLGWSSWDMLDIATGETPITPGLAADLARVFGTTADYWLNLQASWDAWKEGQDAESNTQRDRAGSRERRTPAGD